MKQNLRQNSKRSNIAFLPGSLAEIINELSTSPGKVHVVSTKLTEARDRKATSGATLWPWWPRLFLDLGEAH